MADTCKSCGRSAAQHRHSAKTQHQWERIHCRPPQILNISGTRGGGEKTNVGDPLPKGQKFAKTK